MAMDLSKLPMPKRGEEPPMDDEMMMEEPVTEDGKVPGKGPDLAEVDDATLMAELEKRGFSVSKGGEGEEEEMEEPEMEEEDLFIEEPVE